MHPPQDTLPYRLPASSDSGDRVPPENSLSPSSQSEGTGATSPVHPDPGQDRGSDRGPVPVGEPELTSRMNKSPPKAVEQDEPTHPGAVHSRSPNSPSTEQGEPNQSKHPTTLPGDTMYPGKAAMQPRAHPEMKESPPPQPAPQKRVHDVSCQVSCSALNDACLCDVYCGARRGDRCGGCYGVGCAPCARCIIC